MKKLGQKIILPTLLVFVVLLLVLAQPKEVSAVTGSVTQANMRMSIVNGTAFADFSSAGALAPYIGLKITIKDSANKTLVGYIKAVGTGETYGSELLTNAGLDTTGAFSAIGATKSIITSGCQTGNCLQVTATAAYGTVFQDLAGTVTSGQLLLTSAYIKKGTETNSSTLEFSDINYSDLPPSFYVLPSTWTQYTRYYTARNTGTYHHNYGSATNGQTSIFDTASVKQVLTPSVTGVAITSTAGGPTYNWTSEDSGFNRNDASGYTYSIDTSPAYLVRPPNNLGLVGYWNFNEGNGTIAHDFSGNGNNGTLSGSPFPTWVAGKHGQALNLLTTGIATVNNSPSINLGTTETIAFWVKGATATSYGVLLQKSDYSTTGWAIQNSAGGDIAALYMRIDTSGGTAQGNACGGPSLANVLDNTWHHVVFVLNNGACTAYKDGVGNGGGTYTVGGGFANSAQPLMMLSGSGADTLDDVRIYNRALSASEVNTLYHEHTVIKKTPVGRITNGLVGYWTFDGQNTSWGSNTTNDVSGNGNTGTMTNMSTSTTPVPGVLGQAFNFDGSASYIAVPSSSSLTFGSGDFTLSAWIKANKARSDWRDIIAKYPGGATLQINKGGVACNDGVDTAGVIITNEGNNLIICGVKVVDDSIRHFVTYTRAGTTRTIYVDGAVDFSAVDVSVPSLSGSNEWDIGRLNGGSQNFNGTIDDVRAYSRALSAQEVKQLYVIGGGGK
jgi:hypothetical protein